jgi:lysophospholipase L1-like esterase
MNLVADLALAVVAIPAFLSLVWLARFWIKHAKDDPTVWEGEMRRLAKLDRLIPPPSNPILFVGSSSFRNWKTLATHMTPVSVLNRGFGGSQIHDITYYVPRIVAPFNPRAIVFYAGENDIAGVLWSPRKTPGDIRREFGNFCLAVHAALPNIHIHFISIKPPKRRLQYWPAMQEANLLVRDYCASDARLHYVDIVPAMSDDSGVPRFDVFHWDGLHYNELGYALWTSVIKPILQKLHS